jgi:hypothetical protein
LKVSLTVFEALLAWEPLGALPSETDFAIA